MADDRIDQNSNADKENHNAHAQNKTDRFYTKRSDPIKGKRQHFFQWVLTLSGKALISFIIYTVRRVADQRHHAPQKQVYLFVFFHFHQDTLAHKAEICVVKHNIHAHPLHDLVKSFCCKLLEKCIFLAAASDAVYHILAL